MDLLRGAVLAALVLNGAAVVITMRVNVPLNNALVAAGFACLTWGLVAV
jgi:hypothetical protein